MIRVYVALAVAGLLAALTWSLVSIGEYRAEQDQYEQAIIHLNNTLKESQARHEQTDQMLADTARDRHWLEQEADALAQQLQEAHEAQDCINTAIPDSAAISLFKYRNHSSGSPGTSSENMDRPSASSKHRPTYGQYISAAEQFFQQCNADRMSVMKWSRGESNAE